MIQIPVHYPSQRKGGPVRFTVEITDSEHKALYAKSAKEGFKVSFHTNKTDKCIATSAKLNGGNGQLEKFLGRKLVRSFV